MEAGCPSVLRCPPHTLHQELMPGPIAWLTAPALRAGENSTCPSAEAKCAAMVVGLLPSLCRDAGWHVPECLRWVVPCTVCWGRSLEWCVLHRALKRGQFQSKRVCSRWGVPWGCLLPARAGRQQGPCTNSAELRAEPRVIK